MNPSDFIRARTIGGKPVTRKASADRAGLINGLAELGKVGSNINQIARALNISLKDRRPLDVPKDLIASALQGVAALTTRLLKELDYNDGDTRQ